MKKESGHWRMRLSHDSETNRAWLWIADWCLGLEYVLWKWWQLGFAVSLFGQGGDRLILVSLAIPLFKIYLYVEDPWWLFGPNKPDCRVIGLEIWEDSLYYQLWSDEHAEKTPRWRSGFFRPKDWLFGPLRLVEEQVRGEGETLISMPEGAYVGKYKVVYCTYKRKRFQWLFRMSYFRTTIEVENGIPHRGKWGMDATYSLTCGTMRVDEAVGRFRDGVIEYRDRYGWSEKDLKEYHDRINNLQKLEEQCATSNADA